MGTIKHLARKGGHGKTEAAKDFAKRGERQPPLLVSAGRYLKTWQPATYLIDNVLQDRGLITVCGPPFGGKTSFACHLVRCLVAKEKFAGREVKRDDVRVAYLSGDDPDGVATRLLAYREANILIDDRVDHRIKILPTTEALGVEVLQRLEAELGEFGADVVIVDTGTAYAPSDVESENAALAMQQYLNGLKTHLGAGKRLVLVLVHPPKDAFHGGWPDNLVPRGSGAILGTVDGNIGVWQPLPGIVCAKRVLKLRGTWTSELRFHVKPAWTGREDEDGNQVNGWILEEATAAHVEAAKLKAVSAKRRHLRKLVQAYVNEPDVGRPTLKKILGIHSNDTVEETQRMAVEQGLLKDHGKGAERPRYRITEQGRTYLTSS